MPDIDQRDPEEVARTLSRWLATTSPEGKAPEVFDVRAPASNGFSNETILCRTRDEAGVEKRLVVRVAPTKHLLFMDAAFDTQYRVMKALTDADSPIPLPKLGPFENDPQYLGVPFFTMDHIEGKVPPDSIPYTMEGWVVEATPEEQERMWWSGIEALAMVHRTDWRALGLDWLGMPTRGKPGIVQQMSYYRDYLDWSAKGFSAPVVEQTWQWLVANQPDEDGELVLSWGDSRIGNIIWEDFRAVAVLDWEMASLAQPELDLGWFLYFDRQFTDTLGVPRPPGFPSHEATVERYSELIGRPIGDLFFYEIFSGFRFAVIMLRLSDLLLENEMLPAEADMRSNNIATQLLASMLGFEPPA